MTSKIIDTYDLDDTHKAHIHECGSISIEVIAQNLRFKYGILTGDFFSLVKKWVECTSLDVRELEGNNDRT